MQRRSPVRPFDAPSRRGGEPQPCALRFAYLECNLAQRNDDEPDSKAFFVADVREENEFATGHVDDSINLPLTQLIDVPAAQGKAFAAAFIPNLDTPVLVYCRTGQRSILAAKALLSFGYEKVYDMGGLSGWPYGLSYD